MKRLLVLAFCFVGLSGPSAAQTTGAFFGDAVSSSLASVVRTMHLTIRRDLAEAAEDMPADEYTFKPTAEVRDFGQLVGHLVNANFSFCALAKQEASPATVDYEQVRGKADLVEALNASLSYCDEVYSALTDSTVDEIVTFGSGGEATRGSVLVFNTAHNNEHYGNIVVRPRGRCAPKSYLEQTVPKFAIQARRMGTWTAWSFFGPSGFLD